MLFESSEAFDLVFDLVGSVALMVKHFTDLLIVHLEARVHELHAEDDEEYDHEHGVVGLTLSFERIVTDFVTERLVTHARLILVLVTTSKWCRDVDVTAERLLEKMLDGWERLT